MRPGRDEPVHRQVDPSGAVRLAKSQEHPASEPSAALRTPAADLPRPLAARVGRRVLSRLGTLVASAVVFFSVWYLVRQFGLSDSQRFLLPTPLDVWRRGFADSAVRSEILDGLAVTAKETGVGLLLAGILGVVFGALMSQARWIERSFFPWAIVLQTVPILAIVPLIDLWAKNNILFVQEGFRARIIIIVIIALFPIV